MNIIKFIDNNKKTIIYSIFIIIFSFGIIKFLNSNYKEEDKRKEIQFKYDNQKNNNIITEVSENINSQITTNYSSESKSMPKTIETFVNFCNNRDLENAYKMLTDECKNAMFSTIDEFEELYINELFDVKRTYKLEKYSSKNNMTIYLVSLYGDMLATGKIDDYIQDYFTLVESENGVYRINVNSYIYGKKTNIENTYKNLTVKIENVDIYEEHETLTFTIMNNSNKTIFIKGNKLNENIYIQDLSNKKYFALNSLINIEDIILNPYSGKSYEVEFNRPFSSHNSNCNLIFNDVIWDYEEYLDYTTGNVKMFDNRSSMKISY